jgi:hypothetical protein
MNRSRWISLVFVALWIIAMLLTGFDDGSDDPGQQESFREEWVSLLLLPIGFACVWWSDILGDALWMGRGAWNPKPSSGTAIALLGWIFLFLALAMPIVDFLCGD